MNENEYRVDPTNWDDKFLHVTELVSSWSKDRSRKFGAIIVNMRTKTIVSTGYNGFPRGVDDDIDSRHERPAKYKWVEHAERNAIYNAALNGISTLDKVMYVSWYPCVECAKAIIQCGIRRLHCLEPNWDDATYAEDFEICRKMFLEAGTAIRFIGKKEIARKE